MTLLELIKHLRVSVLDDTGGTGIDWTSIDEDTPEANTLRWSNEELTAFINEAINKVAISTSYLQDYQPSFRIDVNVGQAVYDLDPRIIRIKHNKLVSSGKPLVEQEMEDVEDIADWIEMEGDPTRMILDYAQQKVVLNPTPVSGDILKLWCVRTPMEVLHWEDAEVCETEIPERWQISMLYYAAHLAYSKDESNALDPQAADKMLGRFVNEFSFTSAYSEARRKRSRGRTIKYGGL